MGAFGCVADGEDTLLVLEELLLSLLGGAKDAGALRLLLLRLAWGWYYSHRPRLEGSGREHNLLRRHLLLLLRRPAGGVEDMGRTKRRSVVLVVVVVC